MSVRSGSDILQEGDAVQGGGVRFSGIFVRSSIGLNNSAGGR